MEMEERFAKIKGESRPYHALVRFSGGKDSVCLLHMLKNKYHLRPLAFAVVHPFLNSLTSQKLENIARKLGVDLIKFYPDESVFIKFIRHGLLKGHTYGLKEDIGCDLCSYVYHWITHRMAMRMDIPYLLDGVDATEQDKPLFREAEAMKAAMESGIKYQSPVPDIFCDACGDDYRGSIYDQNIDIFRGENFPTTMSPFTFIEYDYREYLSQMEKEGIDVRQDTLGVQTNCEVRHLFSYIAFKRYDCHPWAKQIAIGLRKGYPTHIEQWAVGGAENLTRQDIMDWLADYKKGLCFIAENRARVQSVKEEDLSKILPHMVRIQGKRGFSIMIAQMLKMHDYADYLGVDVTQFES